MYLHSIYNVVVLSVVCIDPACRSLGQDVKKAEHLRLYVHRSYF